MQSINAGWGAVVRWAKIGGNDRALLGPAFALAGSSATIFASTRVSHDRPKLPGEDRPSSGLSSCGGSGPGCLPSHSGVRLDTTGLGETPLGRHLAGTFSVGRSDLIASNIVELTTGVCPEARPSELVTCYEGLSFRCQAKPDQLSCDYRGTVRAQDVTFRLSPSNPSETSA